jgi:preprotein translocase subunit SecA
MSWENLRSWIIDYADRSLYDLFAFVQASNNEEISEVSQIKLQNLLNLPFLFNYPKAKLQATELNNSVPFLQQQTQISYDLKEFEMEYRYSGLLRELEKSFILQNIDYCWKEHLQKIAFLRDSIRWRAYGQKNPLTEYKREAFNYYAKMLAEIRHRVVYFIFRSNFL